MALSIETSFSLLGQAALARIFDRAVTIWRKVRFRIQGTEEFFDYLTAYGCAVDREYVSFPADVVDRTLAAIAEHRREGTSMRRSPASRPNGASAVASLLPQDIGTRAGRPKTQELSVYTHGQALWICDVRTNRIRPALTADLEDWCRLVDHVGIVRRSHPTFIPTDVPRLSSSFHAFATIMLNSTRPHRVSVYNARMLPYFAEACAIARGSMEAVKSDPVFAVKCWVNSPFMVTRENIEIAMEARRLLGVPITFGVMPVSGASTPVSIAGALAQNTAESLALNAMRLAVDGELHGLTATSTMLDMTAGSHRQSGTDLFLHQVAADEMRRHLFGGVPSPWFPTGVAAATVSAQSLYEKSAAASFAIAGGLRSLGVGCLAYSDVGSPVQLILDLEMAKSFGHLFRDVTTDDPHIGMESILSTVPQGARYLETDHTAAYFREESLVGGFLDARPAVAQAERPEDMIAKATNRTDELITAAENRCPLSEADISAVRSLQREADRAVASDGGR